MIWEFKKTGLEGNCTLFGKNIFNYEWRNTGQVVEVLDPIYNQKHIISVYSVDIGKRTVTFASGEFSNGVYGFYVNS